MPTKRKRRQKKSKKEKKKQKTAKEINKLRERIREFQVEWWMMNDGKRIIFVYT